MNSIRQVEKLNQQELDAGVSIAGSWHNDYKDTAYIFIGGLPFELTEGDIVSIFSQYGNPVHVKLARDKETGKSRGFGWLKYEDQRSTVLAVDNFNGSEIVGRKLRVDHAYYKPQEGEEDEEEREIEMLRKELIEAGGNIRDSDKKHTHKEKDTKTINEEDPMKDYLKNKHRSDSHRSSRSHRHSHHRHSHHTHTEDSLKRKRE